MNYNFTVEFTSFLKQHGHSIAGDNMKLMLSHMSECVAELGIRPQSIKEEPDLGASKFSVTTNDSKISIVDQYNQHSGIYVSSNSGEKSMAYHFNSKLNEVNLEGMFATQEGNYYITQKNDNKVIRPAKTYEQVEEEVRAEYEEKAKHEQVWESDIIHEISRRYHEESEDKLEYTHYVTISFFDLEALGYLKSHWGPNADVESLNDMGIFPDKQITLEFNNPEDLIKFGNSFYKNPQQYINGLNDSEQIKI